MSKRYTKTCCPICGYDFDNDGTRTLKDLPKECPTCKWYVDIDSMISSDDDYAWCQ